MGWQKAQQNSLLNTGTLKHPLEGTEISVPLNSQSSKAQVQWFDEYKASRYKIFWVEWGTNSCNTVIFQFANWIPV